jgi:hypothetical protein
VLFVVPLKALPAIEDPLVSFLQIPEG